MGRHSVASDRRKSSAVLAAVVAPAAMLFAAAGNANLLPKGGGAEPVVEEVAPCCMEIVAALPTAPVAAPSIGDAGEATMNPASVQLVSASRWRVASVPRLLPVGVAPERGLQVRTILAARAISAEFPEIHEIGGVRPDPLPWHPNGLALDMIIPNPSSAEGIALGNEIVAFVLKNAKRFGMQDAIWRGVYYTPGGAQGGGYGHYDHVHVTTTGGGYPTGDEKYYR